MDEIPTPPVPMSPPPAARRWRRAAPWLLVGAALAALALAFGAGALAVSALSLPRAAFAAQAPAGSRGFAFGRGGDFGRAGRGPLTVTAVSGQTITATRADGTQVTIHTSSSTTYGRAGKTVGASAVTSGVKIAVKGANNSDGSINATHVEIVLPGLGGTVTAVSGSDITVKGRDNASHVIHTSSGTTFERAGKTVDIAAVTTGARISAQGAQNSDGSLDAEVVRIQAPHAGGKVTAVSGTTITVQDRRGTQTIHVSGSTTYTSVTFGASGPTSAAASLSDVKTGVFIQAEGAQNSDGSLNAETVRILPSGFGGKHGPHGTQTPAAGGTSTTQNRWSGHWRSQGSARTF